MKRIKLLILLFGVTLMVPLTWLILHTYASLKQEEISRLHFFATELFAQMEDALAAKIFSEESRSADAYHIGNDSPLPSTSKVSKGENASGFDSPSEPFIIGYLQNNPDGSFQSPQLSDRSKDADTRKQLERINTIFNQKKYRLPERSEDSSPSPVTAKERQSAGTFAEKYISQTPNPRQKVYLGRKSKRTEEITASQAVKLAPKKSELLLEEEMADSGPVAGTLSAASAEAERRYAQATDDEADQAFDDSPPTNDSLEKSALKVEVTPFQAVLIDDATLFIFRRVIFRNQVYRQGFAVAAKPLVEYLSATFFLSQPMARFTQLQFNLQNGGTSQPSERFGAVVSAPEFSLNHAFPAPFEFISAQLTCQNIPASAARSTLNRIVLALLAVSGLGIATIYQAVHSVVDLSERRARFVASVTHELKTPLTNINLYIEMLQQGIAASKEKEQLYYQILSSESTRLSRLINNVLELSRLEKKQRAYNLIEGDFDDVITEVSALFQAKLKQEEYTFTVKTRPERPFAYDREIMIQILINLIENSLKFGRNATQREIELDIVQNQRSTHISVSDYGPGIPRRQLKKVFTDFYRVKSADRQTIPGTGIGLALVKKFIAAQGGRVEAANRASGSGCIITVTLPT